MEWVQRMERQESPIGHECPTCDDGGVTCVYDAHPDGTPRRRICLRCQKITEIEAMTYAATL